jgi:uncharacterized membrane protein
MNLQKITSSWNAAMLKLADYGIPIFMLRDPYTKKPSLPFTMMILSIILVVVAMVGKLSALVGGIDKGSAMQFLTTSAALYFGHSWVHNETTNARGQIESTEIKTDQPNNP